MLSKNLRRPAGERRRRIGPGLTMAAVAAGTGLLAAPAPAAARASALNGLLEKGSRGAAVTRLQRALHVRPSGRFGSGTEHAVVSFQRRKSLLVDGIVGPQTWDTLFHIQAPATASSSYSSGYSIPSSIVQCESGGNYAAVNPQTGAGGAYQILPSTWAAYGGQGLPENAPPAEQNQIAAEIYARQGPSAWTC